MRGEGLNRFLFTLGGLLLLGSGGVILVAGLASFGLAPPGQPVITPDVLRMLTLHDSWLWGITAGVSVVFLVLGLIWLLSQLRTQSVARVELEPDRGSGHVRMSASALTDVVSGEAWQVHGVEAAGARLVRKRKRRPAELHLALRLSPRTDIGEAREHLENVAIPHARQAVEPDPLPSRIRLELTRSSGDRVR